MKQVKWDISETEIYKSGKTKKTKFHEGKVPFGKYQIEISEGEIVDRINSFETALNTVNAWFTSIQYLVPPVMEYYKEGKTDYSLSDVKLIFQKHFDFHISKGYEFVSNGLRHNKWGYWKFPETTIYDLDTPIGSLVIQWTKIGFRVFKMYNGEKFFSDDKVFDTLEEAKEWLYFHYSETLEESHKIVF